MRKLFFCCVLILIINVVSLNANPYSPVWISEFSTQEDWIEIYVEGKLNLGTYVVINADSVSIDTLAVEMNDRYFAVLDQTNTSGFDLPEDGGTIELLFDDLKYGNGKGEDWWDWAPAPEEGAVTASIGIDHTPPITWCCTNTPTKGTFNHLLNSTPQEDIVINEVYPNHDTNVNAFVELYNKSTSPVLIHNWILFYLYTSFTIDNIELQGNQYHSFTYDYPKQTELYDKLIILLDDKYYLRDIVTWQPYQQGISYSRYPDGTVTDEPNTLLESIPTPGESNRLKETGVDTIQPNTFTLHQNSPNPFNPTTVIPVTVSGTVHATLAVHNVAGQKVRTLYNGTLDSGYHTFIWNGMDDHGTNAGSGVYIYRFSAGEFNESRSMALVR